MSSSLLRFNCLLSTLRRSTFRAQSLVDKSLYLSRHYATKTAKDDDKWIKTKKFTLDDEVNMLNLLKTSFQDDEKAGDIVPIFKKALLHGNNIAIKDSDGEYTYHRIYTGAKKLAAQISNFCGSGSSSRIAFLCPNDVTYTMILWSCWISGQIGVPLSARYPTELLKYFINDSGSHILITTPEYETKLRPIAESLNVILIVIDQNLIPDAALTQTSYLDPKSENVLKLHDKVCIEGTLNNDFYNNASALIMYTSGTTGEPKGVVITHKNINSQLNMLTDAWQFTEKDSLLHVLPLNHIHGCVNALLCPLNVGAKVVMHNNYDSNNVWSTLLSINTPTKDRVNLFMAVPTIYSFLIDEYDKIFSKNSRMVEYIENHCKKNIRLMVSGSAPLPTTIFNRWLNISGHKLLERYGMTETGMVLSNPYIEDSVRCRQSGVVGLPLPNIEVRIVDAENNELFKAKGESNVGYWSKKEPIEMKNDNLDEMKPIIGELHVKGPNIFKEYYERPKETEKEFVDGYFKTGDVATYENGVFKILGRSSVDIIKTGGHKVSALEIERFLITNPRIKDVAIIGVADETWGQRIAAICVLKDDTELDLESLRVYCADDLASYQIPTLLKIVKEIPRNVMGKIQKQDIMTKYFINDELLDKINEKKSSTAAQNDSHQQQQSEDTKTTNEKIKK